jgi:hypothetical protein
VYATNLIRLRVRVLHKAYVCKYRADAICEKCFRLNVFANVYAAREMHTNIGFTARVVL